MLFEAGFAYLGRNTPQSRNVMLLVRVGMEGQSFVSSARVVVAWSMLGGAMPDIELASPTIFCLERVSLGILSLAPVLHCSVPQLPCAVAPSYSCQLPISALLQVFDHDAITFRSRCKGCASRCRHQLVRKGVQEGVQHS